MQQLLLQLAPPPAPTLANFTPGRNAAALQALRGALGGGERFIYLWGASGCGKSHLLRGLIGAAATRAAGYVSAAGADWPRAAALDVVAVDDVERLDGPGQIALFDLYNRLRGAGGVLAASGSAPPAELALREDLRSRLASGIVLQVHPLSDAEKSDALRGHAASRGIALGNDVIGYLLTRFGRDMSSQIALLEALDRYSLERKRPVTLPLLRDVLQRLSGRKPDA